jgi:cell division protein FtsL
MRMTLEGRNSLTVFRLARGVTALGEIEKTLYGNLVVIGI